MTNYVATKFCPMTNNNACLALARLPLGDVQRDYDNGGDDGATAAW